MLQLSGLSQLAALATPPVRVSHCEITRLMPPPGSGSFQTTYRRPKVGLEGVLSMGINGFAGAAALGTGRPVLTGRNVSVPAAIRCTTIRPAASDSPPYQTFPRPSAASVGSQHMLVLS